MTLLKKRFLRLVKRPPQVLYAVGLGPLYGRLVLLLTTTGRKTGLPRVTPLQYEEIEGAIYVASALGDHADWFRNIQADPHVHVRVGSRNFAGIAEPITDVGRIADFLEYRLRRHPRMVGAIMRREGSPPSPSRADLERYAAQRALVIVREVGSESRQGSE
jgi:deazaflavin-dependent oxidoreductase (nitroreductase family)